MVISIEQFNTGYDTRSPQKDEQANWQNWYDSIWTSFFPDPTVDNGYKLFKTNDLIEANLFKVASQFYADAAMSEGPAMSTEVPAIQEWFEENKSRIIRMLRKAIEDWSIYGTAILATHLDGTIVNINPQHYYRVGNVYDIDSLTGHIIAPKYYQPTPSEERTGQFNNMVPNRIRVTKYSPLENVSTVQTFILEGTVIGTPVTPLENAGITSLITAGEGDSWYKEAKDVGARYMIRLTNNLSVLNRIDNAPELYPVDITNSSDPADTRTPQERVDAFREGVRRIITVSSNRTDNIPFDSLMKDSPVDAEANLVEYFQQLFHILSGVSPVPFGQVGSGESGYAREQAQGRAKARIRNMREDWENGIPLLLGGMGAPQGDVSFSWSTAPFENKVAEREENLKLYDRGVITLDEMRAREGLDKLETSNTPQTEENEEGEDNGS